MSSDFALRLRGIGKRYKIRHADDRRADTLAEAALAHLRRPLATRRREDLWALRNVDLDVHRGDILGIVGHNGAGKSTLLKLLARIAYPSTGQIEVFGRIGSLLEVGTGFHPDLTGRENIFLNGTILGMRHADVARRFDEIVDFAGTERFLDTPVKHYSSGMYVRLAFAVAAHLDTEILLVDEVLAVGDGAFQRKSIGKMGEAASLGRTVLVVSHNVSVVAALASSCVVLDQGGVVFRGDTQEAIANYSTRIAGLIPSGSFDSARRLDRLSSQPAGRIVAGFLDSSVGIYDVGSVPRLRLTIERSLPVSSVGLRVTIQRITGESVGTAFSGPIAWPASPGSSDYSVALNGVALNPGRYLFELELRDIDSRIHDLTHDCVQQVLPFEVAPVAMGASVEQWPPTWGSARWESLTVVVAPDTASGSGST